MKYKLKITLESFDEHTGTTVESITSEVEVKSSELLVSVIVIGEMLNQIIEKLSEPELD